MTLSDSEVLRHNYLKRTEAQRYVKDSLGVSAREKTYAGLGCTEAQDRLKAAYRQQRARRKDPLPLEPTGTGPFGF